MSRTGRIWAVVPAAGVGRRMGGHIPKQYLPLRGKTVLEHTLERLLACRRLERVVVALSADDEWWNSLAVARHSRISRAVGGSERSHSVLNALLSLQPEADVEDWVLVHDAARPCLRPTDIQRMLDQLEEHSVGGILAVPMHDTVKRVGSDRQIQETIQREQLWRAFTPQMFRLGPLISALQQALAAGRSVTDEASAMEAMGCRPALVEGEADNIKITRPEDLPLAALFLEQQVREAG